MILRNRYEHAFGVTLCVPAPYHFRIGAVCWDLTLVGVLEDVEDADGADLLRRLLWGRCWGSDVGGAMALSPFGNAPSIGYLLDSEIGEALTALSSLGDDQSQWAQESARSLSHLFLDVIHADRDLFCVLDSPFPDPL